MRISIAVVVFGLLVAACSHGSGTSGGASEQTKDVQPTAAADWITSTRGDARPAKPEGCSVAWLAEPTEAVRDRYDVVAILHVSAERESLTLNDTDRNYLERTACKLGGDALSSGEGGTEASAYAVLVPKPANGTAAPSIPAPSASRRKPITNEGCMAGCLPDCHGMSGRSLRICVQSCVLFCTKY